ncbi:MAG: non-heme iron oxygenase ferredoxin subunit [Thermodesulfobacteriota bacterium]
MAEFEKVAKTSEINPGEVKSVIVGNLAIAICNSDGEYFAFIDECSHETLPLSDGILDGKTITCAYHGAEFDVESGEALCLPAVDRIETFKLKVDGDDIYVLVED